MKFRALHCLLFVLGVLSAFAAIPSESEILNRFGSGQLGPPIPPFAGGKFSLDSNEVIAFVGQENFVRDQKAGEIEAQLVLAFAAKNPRVRPMAWEADTA